MQTKYWLMLAVAALVIIGTVTLVFSQPEKQSIHGTLTEDISSQDTPSDVTQASLPERPNLAPPATRVGMMIATPNYEALVPRPLSGNFDAAQLVAGRQTYALWCASCHGPQGQGLAIWRFSWDAEHQDCTKAGCHGAKHPPDGFAMKSLAPALLGPGTLSAFANVAQLQFFIAAVMPYQAPGTLAADEYWAVAAFLADQHRADADGKALDATNAADVTLPRS